MERSKEVGQFQVNDYSKPTRGARFNTNHVEMGIRLVYVAACKPPEDFPSWLIKDGVLMGPFIEKGWSWVSCCALRRIIKYVLQRLS
jgi:hypothetical protein